MTPSHSRTYLHGRLRGHPLHGNGRTLGRCLWPDGRGCLGREPEDDPATRGPRPPRVVTEEVPEGARRLMESGFKAGSGGFPEFRPPCLVFSGEVGIPVQPQTDRRPGNVRLPGRFRDGRSAQECRKGNLLRATEEGAFDLFGNFGRSNVFDFVGHGTIVSPGATMEPRAAGCATGGRQDLPAPTVRNPGGLR
jgi:hypothetical protein